MHHLTNSDYLIMVNSIMEHLFEKYRIHYFPEARRSGAPRRSWAGGRRTQYIAL